MSQLFASGGQSIKSFSFSINPSNKYSGLTSFRIDCFDLLPVQRTFKSILLHHSLKASALSILYGPTLSSICDCWKNHSFDCMDLRQQSDVNVFISGWQVKKQETIMQSSEAPANQGAEFFMGQGLWHLQAY